MNASEALKVLSCLIDSPGDEGPVHDHHPAVPFPEKVLIRTVTHYHVGRVVSIDDRWIVLDTASWVADTGRFSVALASGTLGEDEPFAGPVWIAVGSVIDVTSWPYALPTVAK